MDPSHTWEGRNPFFGEREREKKVLLPENGENQIFSLGDHSSFLHFPRQSLGVGCIEFLVKFGSRNFLEWIHPTPGRGETHFLWREMRVLRQKRCCWRKMGKIRFSLWAIIPRSFTFPDRVLGLAALNSSGNLGLGTFQNGSIPHLGGERPILCRERERS